MSRCDVRTCVSVNNGEVLYTKSIPVVSGLNRLLIPVTCLGPSVNETQ